MSIGNFPESLSQATLVGIKLVGRLGVLTPEGGPPPRRHRHAVAVRERSGRRVPGSID